MGRFAVVPNTSVVEPASILDFLRVSSNTGRIVSMQSLTLNGRGRALQRWLKQIFWEPRAQSFVSRFDANCPEQYLAGGAICRLARRQEGPRDVAIDVTTLEHGEAA